MKKYSAKIRIWLSGSTIETTNVKVMTNVKDMDKIENYVVDEVYRMMKEGELVQLVDDEDGTPLKSWVKMDKVEGFQICEIKEVEG